MLPLRAVQRVRSRTRPSTLLSSFYSCRFRGLVTLAYELHEPPATSEQSTSRGTPIIVLHGLFGSKRNNRSISKVLARDLNRPVYNVDLRNHGDSPHDLQHDYTALAEDVEGFMDQHALKDPTLIGHSMGAKTAMTVALRSPERVAALIPVDNAPVDAALKSDFGKYIQGMRKVEEAHVSTQSEADSIMKEYEESLPIRQFLLTNLIRDPPTSPHLRFRIPISILANALDNMGDFPFTDPDTHRHEGPTLIVRGSHSHYVADETLPVIGRFFPRFEVRDVEAGHWLISEKPEEFRRVVVEFLQDKD